MPLVRLRGASGVILHMDSALVIFFLRHRPIIHGIQAPSAACPPSLPAYLRRQSSSMERRPVFKKSDIRCPHCPKRCKNQSGLTQHLRSKHRPFAQRARPPASSSGSGSARSPSPQNYQAGGDVEERHSPSLEPPLLRIRQHPILNGKLISKSI